MSSSSYGVLLDVELQPGKAADAAGEATGDVRRAGRPSTGTRCARSSLEHGSVLVRGLGLRDAAEITASSGGWPPA